MRSENDVDGPLTVQLRRSFLVGDRGAAALLKVAAGPVVALASMSPVTLSLPEGRWRVRARIEVSPAGSAPPPAEATIEVDLGQGRLVAVAPPALRLYRGMDGEVEVRAAVDVERHVDGRWDRQGRGGASVTLRSALPAGDPPLYGANIHVLIPGDKPPGALDQFLARMAELGMQAVRTSLPWGFMEPEGPRIDQYKLAQADAFFEGCARNGLRAVVIIDAHAASWSSGARPSLPARWGEFQRYVTDCMKRWGDTIIAVQSQNEPNNPPGDQAFGVEGIVAASAAVKAGIEAAGCAGRVASIGPAIAFGDAAYLDVLYQAGLGPTLDGVSVHPYGVRFDVDPPHFSPPERAWGDLAGDPYHLVSGVEAVREVMAAHGDGEKPVWVTEYGYSTSRTGPGGSLGGLDVTEEQQAAWLATSIRQAACLGNVKAFLIYMVHDNPWAGVAAHFEEPEDDETNWQRRFGLVSWDNSRTKPAFDAVREAIAAATSRPGGQ